MTLTRALDKRYGTPRSRMQWKIIAYLAPGGKAIFDDGTTGMVLSGARFSVGDKVMVLDGKILSFKWQDVPPVIFHGAAPSIIICYAGDTSRLYEKMYFAIVSGAISEVAQPAGWSLTDDGLYVPTVTMPNQDDPNIYAYKYNGGGIGVPSVRNGCAAKQQEGRSARFILSPAVRNDGWFEHDVEYTSGSTVIPVSAVGHPASLLWLQYQNRKVSGSSCYYLNDSIIAMHDRLNADGSIEEYSSDTLMLAHKDEVQVINRIFRYGLDGGSNIQIDIEQSGASAAYILASAPGANKISHRIIRAELPDIVINDDNFFGSPLACRNAAHFVVEEYDLTTGQRTETGRYHRTLDEGDISYIPSELTAGYLFTRMSSSVDYSPTSRFDRNISADTKLIAGVSPDGKEDYIRVRNPGLYVNYGYFPTPYRTIDLINLGVYCASALVEETGEIETVKINMPFCTPGFFPILPVNYRILHTHHDDSFHAMIYMKTEYQSHAIDGLDYIESGLMRVDRLQVVSKTTYWLAVNGVRHQLSGECINREYLLNRWTNTDGSGSMSDICQWVHSYPWVDIGYAANGVATQDSKAFLSGFYTTATRQSLLVSYDVFSVEFRHCIQRLGEAGQYALIPAFNESTITYPPYCDEDYAQVTDRKWLLFDASGSLTGELQPPQKQGGGHIQRINGLVMLDPTD